MRDLETVVTGASGFIGRHVVTTLERQGTTRVRPITRRAVRLDDDVAVATALRHCGAVVHCAFDKYDLAANVRHARVLGTLCARFDIPLVLLSSAAVHEPFPDGTLTEDAPAEPAGIPYSDTKIAVERELARHEGLRATILRPTVVYGPFGEAWTDAPIRELLAGPVILPDAGLGLCNAVHVEDVAQAVALALRQPAHSGEAFLISGPQPTTWRNFLDAYQEILGIDSLDFMPRSDIEAQSAPDQGCGSRSLLAWARNSAALASLRGTVARRLPSGVNRWLSDGINGHSRGRPRIPHGTKLALYASRCAVSIDKARRVLGYEPRFDLAGGMAATAPYVIHTHSPGRGSKAPSVAGIPRQGARS